MGDSLYPTYVIKKSIDSVKNLDRGEVLSLPLRA